MGHVWERKKLWNAEVRKNTNRNAENAIVCDLWTIAEIAKYWRCNQTIDTRLAEIY